MPYPSRTARSRLTFELSRQTGLRRKPKGNISPAFLRPFGSKRQSRAIAVPRWSGDSKGGNQGGDRQELSITNKVYLDLRKQWLNDYTAFKQALTRAKMLRR